VNTLPSRYQLSRIGLLACLAFFLIAQEPPARSVWDGVYTQEQATRGQASYNKECAACHGQSLSGGEEAPPLSGGAFLANWNGLTVGDLFERIRVSMPEGRPGTLSRQQDADILAYILTGNQFPAGKTELNKETELLKQIRFESARPEPKE
jgi:mono/diheme cytochrome c family protein